MSEMESKRTKRAGSGFAPGKAVGEDSLKAGMGELKKQHPQKYNDRGPHHEKGSVKAVKKVKAVR